MQKTCLKSFLLFMLFSVVSGGAALAESNAPLQKRLKDHIRILCESKSGRAPGTEGHFRAREYLMQEMGVSGLSTANILNDTLPPSYEVRSYLRGNWFRGLLGKTIARTFPIADPGEAQAEGYPIFNLIGVIKSKDPKVQSWRILMAHYDHLAPIAGQTRAGALDNASSVAVLLEVARLVKEAERGKNLTLPSHLLIAFTDREEISDLGYAIVGADQLKSLLDRSLDPAAKRVAIAMDLLGAGMVENFEPRLFVLGHEEMNGDCGPFAKALDQERLRGFCAPISILEGARFPLSSLPKDMMARSDYRPFRDVDTPSLFLTTGSPWFYHTVEDKPERLNYALLEKTTRFVFDVATASTLENFFDQAPGASRQPKTYSPILAQALIQMNEAVLKETEFYTLKPQEKKLLTKNNEDLLTCSNSGCERDHFRKELYDLLLLLHETGERKSKFISASSRPAK